MNGKLWLRRLVAVAAAAIVGVLLSGPIVTAPATPAAISVDCRDGGC
ncbi:hypothetical protein [Actinoplanes cyaneus]|nr:hypothetical protein [Actinoplanes cyaneus]MCW2144201.1 hypothetical protein [Actinoplanes cyaneus]